MIPDLPVDVQDLLLSYCSLEDLKNLSRISHTYKEALGQFLYACSCIDVSTLRLKCPPRRKKLTKRLEVFQHAQHLAIKSSSFSGKLPLGKSICKTLNKYLSGLTELNIFCKGILLTDDRVGILSNGLVNLKRLHLRNGMLLTDKSMIHIGNLVSLEDLMVTSSGITNKGVKCISVLPLLETLHLGYNNLIDDVSLQHLAKLPVLKSLTLCHCPRIQFNINEDCSGFGLVEELILYGCPINVPTGTVAIGGLRKLRKLDLSNCQHLNNVAVSHLVNLSELTELGLSYCKGISRGCFPYLREMGALQKLSIGYIDTYLLFEAKKELNVADINH